MEEGWDMETEDWRRAAVGEFITTGDKMQTDLALNLTWVISART